MPRADEPGAQKAVDPEAVKVHYRQGYKRLYRHALGVIGSPETADDIVQEAYASTIESIGRGTEINNLGAWLNRCVYNLSVAQFRRQKSLPLNEDVNLTDCNTPADAAQAKERCDEVYRVVKELSPDQRSAFILAEVKGLDCSEVADGMKRSAGAVRQLLSRARQHIRESVGTEPYVVMPVLQMRMVVHAVKSRLHVLRDHAAAALSNMQATAGTFVQQSADVVSYPAAALVTGALVVGSVTGLPVKGPDGPVQTGDTVATAPVPAPSATVVAPLAPDNQSSKSGAPGTGEPAQVAPVALGDEEPPDSDPISESDPVPLPESEDVETVPAAVPDELQPDPVENLCDGTLSGELGVGCGRSSNTGDESSVSVTAGEDGNRLTSISNTTAVGVATEEKYVSSTSTSLADASLVTVASSTEQIPVTTESLVTPAEKSTTEEQPSGEEVTSEAKLTDGGSTGNTDSGATDEGTGLDLTASDSTGGSEKDSSTK